jgi:PKD repeat protein
MKEIFYIVIFLLFSSLMYGQERTLCEVSYSFQLNNVNQMIDFTNKADGPKVVTWKWDFGDGTVSNVPNPTHVYMQAGTYVACLTIETESGCENVYCDTINVGLLPNDTSSFCSVSGNVRAGNVMLPSGVVLLIRKVNNQYIVLHYYRLDSVCHGHYEFSQIQSGQYLLYAIPRFDVNVNYWPVYLPSYYGNSTNWNNASLLNIYNSLYYKDIQLVCDQTLLYGPDTISGSLSVSDPNNFEYNVFYQDWFGNIPSGQQPNLEEAPNMPVLLLNEENIPIRYALTDENGNFRFTNLPIRVYKVYPEKAGFLTVPSIMNMQNISGNSANCSFYIGSNSINIGFSEPDYSDFESNLMIYPNPVSESVTISIVSDKAQEIYISVENIEGKEVIEKERFISYGHENYLIPVTSLKAGVYFVKIQPEGFPLSVRKIIKQ